MCVMIGSMHCQPTCRRPTMVVERISCSRMPSPCRSHSRVVWQETLCRPIWLLSTRWWPFFARDYEKARAAARDLASTGVDPDSASALMARAAVDTASREFDAAIEQLARLVEDPAAPADAYLQLARLQARRGRQEEARETLDLGVRRIGRDYRFLPSQIELARQASDTELAESLTVSCAGYDLGATVTHMLNLLQVENVASSSYYDTCVQRLGYDVLAKRNDSIDRDDAAGGWMGIITQTADMIEEAVER